LSPPTRFAFSFMRLLTISATFCARWRRRSRSRSHGEVDSDRRSGRVRLRPPTLETTMQTVADRPEAPNAIRNDLGAIFISLELSRSTWLITSLSPDGGEKMSKHSVPAAAASGILVQPLRAATECEVDLVRKRLDHGNGLRPWIPNSDRSFTYARLNLTP